MKRKIKVTVFLCYGIIVRDDSGDEVDISIPWLEEQVENHIEEIAFDDFLAKISGIKKPADLFEPERYRDDPIYRIPWQEYAEKKNDVEEKLGMTLLTVGSDAYPQYVLAVRDSVQEATDGEYIELGREVFVSAEWRKKFLAFCQLAKIPHPEPQLIICSYTVVESS